MECWSKPVYRELNAEELKKISVKSIDVNIRKKILENWDRIAKPLDSMGQFEKITAQIGAILGTDKISIGRRALIVFCADNGIVAEGVTQSGQDVTSTVAEMLGRGASSSCVLAKAVGADVFPVDIGVNGGRFFGVIDKKIRRGTENFALKKAMSEDETLKAIAVGMETADKLVQKGYKILAIGEMGIGNTTTASAVTAALLKTDAEAVAGRGAGLCDEGLRKKKKIISSAIEKYGLYDADALTVLSSVGGLDIAGMAGACIGCAVNSIPVVLDGAISFAAALTAERLVPGVRQYLIASHKSREASAGLLAKALGLEPVIDADMALGEGTGALMLFPLIDTALSLYNNGLTFDEIGMEGYKRFGR